MKSFKQYIEEKSSRAEIEGPFDEVPSRLEEARRFTPSGTFQFPSANQAKDFMSDIYREGRGNIQTQLRFEQGYGRKNIIDVKWSGTMDRVVYDVLRKHNGYAWTQEGLKEAVMDDRKEVAKELKRWAKRYVSGPISVKSGSGKTPFVQITARGGEISNDLRKMVIDKIFTDAKVRDMNDISYGNVTKNYIAITSDQWKKIMGLDETIVKSGDKWKVMNKDKSRTLGTHDSKKMALKQLAAVEISKASRGK